jgi:hypothetical protein
LPRFKAGDREEGYENWGTRNVINCEREIYINLDLVIYALRRWNPKKSKKRSAYTLSGTFTNPTVRSIVDT